MNISTIAKNAISAVGKAELKTVTKVKKFSPEILLCTGIISIVGGTIYACKSTLASKEVIEDARNKMGIIKETEITEDYSEEDRKKDAAIVYLQTAGNCAKKYAPSIALMSTGIFCVLYSHNIEHGRVIAASAAYKIVEEGFNKYRDRVKDILGEDRERDIYYGANTETITSTKTLKNGKKKEISSEIKAINADDLSMYARIFDDASANWTKSPEYNLAFLKAQEAYCNDMLKAQGHLFLNDVYGSLGFDHTDYGQIVGWIYGLGDSYIDFGIYSDYNLKNNLGFIEGYEPAIILDFNVDGIVWDKI